MNTPSKLLAVCVCALALSACHDSVAIVASPDDPSLGAEQQLCDVPGVSHQRAFGALKFREPVQLVQAPGDARYFVVEKQGVIRSFVDGAADSSVFLDARTRVHADWEEGMFSIAFHPLWSQGKREAYVAYTGFGGPIDFQWRLSRFRSTDGQRLELASEQVLFRADKPFKSHNAGQVAFGPDGLLYFSIGDGGSVGDPRNLSQNLNVPFGKMMRIDVNAAGTGARPYGIPTGNPFVSGGGLPEIYAWGLRNPWRFSFDGPTRELWAGDVGQDGYEEIDVVVKGGNYGWNIKEALHCHNRATCDVPGLKDPVVELPHSDSTSVTGGFVYRGTAITGLAGRYVFADFVSGKIFVLAPDVKGKLRHRQVDQVGKISALGQDAAGELYVVDYASGALYKLVPGPCESAPPPPNSRHYTFLMRDGIGTLEGGNAYYAAIGATSDMTLESWKAGFIGSRPTVSSFFRNTWDLGFWREMTCTQTLGRGEGGCFVRNWKEAGDQAAGKPDLGTVAMNVSPEGFTRFYVFAPGGKLSPGAVLDSEGEKFVPHLCTPCHGGTPGGDTGDLGSVFREFEPSLFQAPPGQTADALQPGWHALNQAVKSANVALKSEAEGATFGVDAARTAMNTYIDAIYGTQAPVARDLRDLAHLPRSWATGPNPVYRAAKQKLWTDVVAPYCMGCHRVNPLNFEDYSNFEMLGAESKGVSVIHRYVLEDPADPQRLLIPWMPQSELMSVNMRRDAAALKAIDEWLTQNANPLVPQSKVTFTVHGGDMTVVGQEIHILGSIDELSRWNPDLGGLQLSTRAGLWPTWVGSRALPQGRFVEFKAVVIQNGNLVNFNGNGGWERGANHTFTVPSAPQGSVTVTFRK